MVDIFLTGAQVLVPCTGQLGMCTSIVTSAIAARNSGKPKRSRLTRLVVAEEGEELLKEGLDTS